MFRLMASTAALLMAATGASAQMVDAKVPATIINALQDLGYRATLSKDGSGDPKISSTIDGTDYSIFTYGCENNRNCKYLQFSVGFDLDNGTTFQSMNEWNEAKLFGEASVDNEMDPFLTYFISTDGGGLTAENFADVIDWWDLSVSEFKEHIDW